MKKAILIALVFLLAALPGAHAAASFSVTAFSCSPSEVKVNDQFSCTATVQNDGDAAGTLSTATLYPSGSWMESASYASSVNANVNSGATTTISFTGLKGTSSGNNGFARILLDSVTDTYTADNNVKVNVIDIALTVTKSATSAAQSSTFTTTGQATAGGNADVTLTFAVTSSSCTIGSQSSSVTTNDLTDGQTTSNTWTVTEGSASCVYSITASATSDPSGTATKSTSSSSTVTCSDCVSESPSPGGSSPGGGGGGGGGGSGATQCSDNLDNDNDGLIDLKDPGCESAADASEKDPVVCSQEWTCGDWGACEDGKQTRTCTDKNDCLAKKEKKKADKIVEVTRPAESQACTGEGGALEPVTKVGKKITAALTGEGAWKTLAAIAVIGGAAAVYYLTTKKQKTGKKSKEKEE